MHFAPGIWAAANSVSERTSIISGFSPERHNCESSRTLMVAVNRLFLSFRKSPARNKRIRTHAVFLRMLKLRRRGQSEGMAIVNFVWPITALDTGGYQSLIVHRMIGL